jgi:hypothetical protein
MPTPTHHEINVTFDGTHAVPVLTSNLKVPDTVHYSSAAGDVTIEFVENGSPFVDGAGHDVTMITSAMPPMPLSKRSATGFACRCFITLASGTTVGWGPNSPQSGGNHIVK